MSYINLIIIVMTVLILLAYLPFSRIQDFAFEDGVLAGVIYFVACPLFVTLLEGRMDEMKLLNIGPYTPLEDTKTSIFLCIGIIAAILFQGLSKIALGRRFLHPPRGGGITTRPVLLSPHWQMILIWGLCLLYTFFASGKADSGHWMENMADNMVSNPLLIIVANFQNIYRAVVFGILYNQYRVGRIGFASVSFIGLFICIADIVFSFNRITMAFYIVMMLMVLRRYFVLIAALMVPGLPMVAYLSNIWTVMRGIALEHGFSFGALVQAFGTATTASQSGKLEMSGSVSNIFEGSNLQTFNWIVEHAGGDFPLLWGKTFFLRPLLVLIPSTLAPGKPLVFGSYVGNALGGKGLAVNSTLFGEAVGNFGDFWLIPLLLMMALLVVIYRAVERRWPAARGWGFFIGFGLSRWDASFAFISLVALVPFLLLSNGATLMRPRTSGPRLSRAGANLPSEGGE